MIDNWMLRVVSDDHARLDNLQLCASHTMGDSDNRTSNIVAEVVDHMQQIPGMIMPMCCSLSVSSICSK